VDRLGTAGLVLAQWMPSTDQFHPVVTHMGSHPKELNGCRTTVLTWARNVVAVRAGSGCLLRLFRGDHHSRDGAVEFDPADNGVFRRNRQLGALLVGTT
jgi:hypothetical protein